MASSHDARGMESDGRVVVIGAGATGFSGAITATECGTHEVMILEKGPQVLTKVRISGGGRCNVAQASFSYPKSTLS